MIGLRALGQVLCWRWSFGDGGNATAQAQQNQQAALAQAQQYAAAQKREALSGLADYLKQNPFPVTATGNQVLNPDFSGAPTAIGGGMTFGGGPGNVAALTGPTYGGSPFGTPSLAAALPVTPPPQPAAPPAQRQPLPPAPAPVGGGRGSRLSGLASA